MTRKPEELELMGDLEQEGGRIPFEDPAALDELRRNAFETIGLPWAIGVLYGVGMGQGLRDGLRVAQAFGGVLGAQPEFPGAPIPMLFTPHGGRPGERLTGALRNSLEARLHRSSYPAPEDPICFVSSGYSAGWYSALFGEFHLVRETACLARGADECRFESRPAREWSGPCGDWARELLPYLDYDQLVQSARDGLALEGGNPEQGGMLGSFDPLSPAAHVWGPVLVLPYSGADDSLEAISVIRADLGPEQLRVVVLDVTGARVDGVESAGLIHVIEAIEGVGMEAVVAGLRSAECLRTGDPARALRTPLVAPDLTRAIALAFQLALPDEG